MANAFVLIQTVKVLFSVFAFCKHFQVVLFGASPSYYNRKILGSPMKVTKRMLSISIFDFILGSLFRSDIVCFKLGIKFIMMFKKY